LAESGVRLIGVSPQTTPILAAASTPARITILAFIEVSVCFAREGGIVSI
jgi:hypothetical protein